MSDIKTTSIIEVFRSFQTQEQCLAHLEQKRWKGEPNCLYCGSLAVSRHASGDRKQQRWQCRDCHKAFAVTVGTIFHGTHMPLQQWFLVVALMLNAKKSASACQIARDLGIRRATVWSMMHRIRVAMAEDQVQSRLLHGLVEADETFVGGKPRKQNRHDNETDGRKRPNGRRTEKTPIIGAIERGGRVVAQMADDVSATTLGRFLSRFVERAGTMLLTDEWAGYRRPGVRFNHTTINHKVEYANGPIHTNTIEGFWGLLKRAHYGQHHKWGKEFIPLYVSEACYKYNHRKDADAFATLLGRML